MIYPCIFIYKEHRKFLAWEDRDVGGAIFRKDTNTECLLICESISDLKAKLDEASQSRFCEELFEINFDEFWVSVKNLRINRASSIKTCKILLDGWNIMEDLIRTVGQESDLLSLRCPVLDKLYEKLFWGNNLPAVTPEGASYSPIWMQEEIIIFRREMRKVWNEFFPKTCF
jgi:hypothetical protein